MIVRPLFGALPAELQMRVFEPAAKGVRKVILATNIAETSLTISGVTTVVDCGLVKQRSYNPRLGTETLVHEPVSQAQARQRAGRAGREGPGQCYRLYTEASYVNQTSQKNKRNATPLCFRK
jgi:ATP-dependent RNA helicase DHX8/PRP22